MNGPIIVGIVFALIFAAVKWRVQMRDVLIDIGWMTQPQQPPQGGVAQQQVQAGAQQNQPPRKKYGWWLTVPGAIVLIALVVWLLTSAESLEAPSTKTVWDWTKSHWLWILLALGVVALLPSLINFPKEKEKAAGALRKAVVVLLLALWFVIPICNRIWGEKPAPPPAPPSLVATAPIPLQTVPKKDWPSQDMEPWRGGKTLLITVAPHKRVVMEGRDFRYHCVYDGDRESSFVRGEKPCSNDGIRFVYASNESDQPNAVIYAYAAEGAELDI